MAIEDTSLRYNNLGDVITPVAEGLGNYTFNNLLGSDTEWGRGLGTLLAQGSSAALGRMGSNLYKGLSLFEGVGQNAGQALAGAGVGVLSNWAGRGITSAMGDSTLGRGIGAGTATALGSIGGTIASNLVGFGNIAGKADKLFGTVSAAKKAADIAKVESLMNAGKTLDQAVSESGATSIFKNSGAINPYALGMQVAGTALGAMTGPSKEYGGTYGNITRTMDSIYDAATAGANFIPGVGQGISAAMTLNKGLSNIFGSTDGMTKADAILGSAWMPAFVKWGNMIGAKKTDKFMNQSWLNLEKATTFMQNRFGDLNEKFEKARRDSEKVFGGGYKFLGFKSNSKKYNAAQENIAFANPAWEQILEMADNRELQNIRSLYMSSINNQRYSSLINGGFNLRPSGKQGMKILNNATNHNMGLRLLSAAALIDNKAMILSAQGGTKITRLRPTPIRRKPATREENPELWDEWERREAEQQTARLRVYDLEQQAASQRTETNARHALHYSNLATGIAETAQQNAQFEPVTQESLQNSNTEQLRLEQLADKDEYFDNGMKFINAAGFADLGVNVAGPLLLRGFRWAFNKVGLLVKVPKTALEIKMFPRGLTNDEQLVAAGKNPEIYLNTDVGTLSNSSTTPLTQEQISKAFEEARQWHLNRINSQDYHLRALRAGFTEEEIPLLLQLLTKQINSLRLLNREKLFPNTFADDDYFKTINAEYWRLPTNKGMFLGIGFYNPNMSYDEAVSKFIHEFGHGATFGLDGTETAGLAGKLIKQFPLISRLILYNKSLYPKITEEIVKQVYPHASKINKLGYYAGNQEIQARGYEFMRDFSNNKLKLMNSENSIATIRELTGNRFNSRLFKALTGNKGALNFYKNALNYGVPLTIGGATIYNQTK